MYDTIGLWLEQNNMARVRSGVNFSRSWTNQKTGVAWRSGRLKNLYVKQGGNGISVTGSFLKWLTGNGLGVLSKESTALAIEKLSDELGLPMSQANVYRIDFGANFIMSKPIRAYTSLFEETRRFRMNTYNNRQSVYYIKTGRRLVFYDKLAEMRQKKSEKTSIPDSLIDKHILRYEIRFLTRAAYYLNQPVILASQLSDEKTFALLNHKFFDFYFSLNRNRRPRAGVCLENWRQLQASLCVHGLHDVGGKQIVLDQIDIRKHQGLLHKVKASRLRSKINSIWNTEIFTMGTDEMAELDTKVRETYQGNL